MSANEYALRTFDGDTRDHSRPGTAAARKRIALIYLVRHGRLPAFENPTRFTELVQMRKLTNRDMILPTLADKVLAKQFVASRLGHDWIIPTLWTGVALPAAPKWPLPIVVKSRHGCNQCAFVRSENENWQAVRRRASAWVNKGYGRWLDEWLYSKIERGLLVEPFVGSDGKLPMDYKLYVFGGRVEFIQVHIDREHHHRWIVLDRHWRRVSAPTVDSDPAQPHSLGEMIRAAETLGAAFDFVRSDFYEIDRKPLFGELTFYPGSGLDRFNPISLDQEMGAFWLTALSLDN